MYNVLILGGTTFVSSNLCKHLICKGYNVDILTRGLRKINYHGYKNHLICDRKNIDELRKALLGKTYDYILDISGYTKEDVENVVETIDSSKLKKYIFCSSGAVYKENQDLICEDFKRGENKNFGDYGLNKKLAEDYLLEKSKKDNYPIIIFRPTYIYGEENNLYRETYFFDKILDQEPIPIPYGNAKTQFIHIDDLVRAFESAMKSNVVGKAYNITHPRIITFKELVKTCGKVMRKTPIIREVNTEDFPFSPRSYFPFRNITYMLDITELIKDNIYIPKIDLEEGLKKSFCWYLNSTVKLEDNTMINIDKVILA
ncbi:3-beta hydroxysteroid dehydrogenase/isomerase family protein [Clostridium argentinense CDC 2741]|uniref:3-beta hydroxysteroid dehydrogenase/isomerase family protein n=1 Tax=Clostridium argentinense CDC 2741 TaxID=1418104 RepID=A0A0C1TZA4_9CLOT|nr:NAD-dependent epimerase/dehydratase family protein [Clostridium argentinense]ARC83892.1 epimerase [Clostridium argentinense]KIE44598.1 3-beta hydroxysteroid dehydrogenase/isomerase family protein [Clostridium argentinense CDC 2741]NFF39801.1 NAD-dependent epimerase/dehydratase family protein [Clostridium argentinense]NFP49801.1 NAD-dependent epimerase/dehydratase family protein [Clostridium argentinense]NFP72202.1 NAD-dependent epimerase/dehydratase family protein [Clostridium argentinense]